MGAAPFAFNVTSQSPFLWLGNVSDTIVQAPANPALSGNRTLTLGYHLTKGPARAATIIEAFLEQDGLLARQAKVVDIGSGGTEGQVTLPLPSSGPVPRLGIVVATSASDPVQAVISKAGDATPPVYLSGPPEEAKVAVLRLDSAGLFTVGFLTQDTRSNLTGGARGPGAFGAGAQWQGSKNSLFDFDFEIVGKGAGSWSVAGLLSNRTFTRTGFYGGAGSGGNGFTEDVGKRAAFNVTVNSTLSTDLEVRVSLLVVSLPARWSIQSTESANPLPVAPAILSSLPSGPVQPSDSRNQISQEFSR